MRRLVILLLVVLLSLNLYSNNTLLEDNFYQNYHKLDRNLLKQHLDVETFYLCYTFYNSTFLVNENNNWYILPFAGYDAGNDRIIYADNARDALINKVIGIRHSVVLRSDNHKYIYISNLKLDTLFIRIYNFNYYNDSLQQLYSYYSVMEQPVFDVDFNYNNSYDDLEDDKIWVIGGNKIYLLKFNISNNTLSFKKSWTNIGGNSNERYTKIAIGKEYGIQNEYVYVYDSTNNRILELESGQNYIWQYYLVLRHSRTMPSDWIIKSITTDYFGSVWLSEYNHGYLQSYTPNLQQPLTTANWSFRANKPVSFTMAMDKPYGILTEKWTNTTGVRLYKLGTEIFYDSVKQDNPQIAQIRLHFRVTVGSYITFQVENALIIYNEFYLPGEYNRSFTAPNWNTGYKSWSLKAKSACTNPDGTPTAVVTKTGVLTYYYPYSPPPCLYLNANFELGTPPNFTDSRVRLEYGHNNKKRRDIPDSNATYNLYKIYIDGNFIQDTRNNIYYSYGFFPNNVYHIYYVEFWQLSLWDTVYVGNSPEVKVYGVDTSGYGCPYFYIKENGKYIPQNTIMHYGYSNKQDNYLFNYSIREKEELRDNDIINDIYNNKKTVINAAISENEVEKDYIDRINLKAVKYDSIYNLTLNTKGEYIFWKDVYKIDSCKNAKGEDILPLVENMGDSFYTALPGDTIYIYASTRCSTRCCDKANASGNSNRGGSIIIGPGVKPKGKGKGKDIEPSIEIEYKGGKSWVNGGEIYPREYIYASYNDIPLLSDSIRFVINNEVKIDYILFPQTENIKYNEINLELINPTLKGKNVMKQIIKEDSAYINLINGDTLYFSFSLITSAKRERVSYILETDGYYNIDNKRNKGESATIPKSNIKFISGVVYLQSKVKMFSNYEIYNISGRQVGQGEIKTGKIKLQKLCNGIYFIKLKGKHRSETHKFEVIR